MPQPHSVPGETGQRTFSVYRRSVMASILAVLLFFNLTALPDQSGGAYLERALGTSLTAFVATKLLNSVVSIIQDMDISIGIGASITVSPGELLDPVNDLLEYFAELLVLSIASLGIQKILMSIAGWWGIQVMTTIAIAWLLLATIFSRQWSRLPDWFNDLIYKLMVVTLMLRFLVPLVTLASDVTETLFLHPNITHHVAQLEQISQSTRDLSVELKISDQALATPGAAMGKAAPGPAVQDSTGESLLEKAKNALKDANPVTKINKVIDQINTTLNQSFDSIFNLISLFVMQVIIFPLLFLWVALRLGRALLAFKLRILLAG